MDFTGLDVSKLKELAIVKWRSAPELWPAKVLALARTLELEQARGGKLQTVGGYFTCLRPIRFRTPQEMEAILGFAEGTFASGVSVWKFRFLPTTEQFELRGYTQLPGGQPFDGIVLRRSDASRPQFFTKAGKPVQHVPGLAVEQWELRVQVPVLELQRVLPGARFTNWF